MKKFLLPVLLCLTNLSFSQDYIFWGTFIQNEIGRANTDGSNVIQVVVENTTRGMVAEPFSETLYYVEGTGKKVKKVEFDGSNASTITTLTDPLQIDIDTRNSHLYVSDRGTNAIYRMNLDGSDLIEFITGMENPNSIQLNLEESSLYFMQRIADETMFYRSDLSNQDGLMGSELLFTISSNVGNFEIDFNSKKIYWTDRTNEEVRRADLDGNNMESLAPGNDIIGSIRVDQYNNKIYWSDNENGQIMTYDIETEMASVFRGGIDGLSQIELKIDPPPVENAPTVDLYWGDYISADLKKLNKNEKGVKIVVSRQNTPRGMGIDIDKNKIFWIEATRDQLKCANISDGIEQVISSFTNASSIALDIEKEQIYVVDIDEDVIKRVNYDGSGKTTIIGTNDDLTSVFLEFGEEKIYWLQKGARSRFYKANFDGSNQALIFETQTDIINFDIDYWNEKIYFTDRTEKAIRICNIDGTGMKNLVNSFEKVNIVKVDPQNERIYWTEPTKNRIRTADLDGSNISTIVNGATGIAGITIGARNTSSTKNNSLELFEVFPNPANDFLIFNSDKPGNLSIFSNDNKIQFSQRSQVGENNINIQNLTPGGYFMILEENGKYKISKFIKSK